MRDLPANRFVAEPEPEWRPLQPPGWPGPAARRKESGEEAVDEDATTCEADVWRARAFFVDRRNKRLKQSEQHTLLRGI